MLCPKSRELLDGFDPKVPLEQAHTIPALWYVDRDWYEDERQRVFGRTWQLAGRAEDVARPGSALSCQIAGEPILAVRDREGTLRAFFNVCRHRAAPIVTQEVCHPTRLLCQYHGWTYDLAGRLVSAPQFEGVETFAKEDHSLIPLAVATKGPFVFVHWGAPTVSLDEYLGPFADGFAGSEIDQLRFVQRKVYDLACNWKVYVDNYLDGGYHVGTIHPGLAGVLDNAHYTTRVDGNTAVQQSPIKPADAAGDPRVAQVRSGSMAYYWWIYPNLMVNTYAGVMDTNLVLPLGVDRCRVVFDFYFSQTEGDSAREYIARSIGVADQIQSEDVWICEAVQRGLGSKGFSTGRFSVRREIAGHHFHRLLAQSMAGN